MNWSLIILGLVALSSVAIAENSYFVILPKLFKVGYDNQFSVYIAAASQPVDVKFELVVGERRVQGTVSVKSGETRNGTLSVPMDWPIGPAELSIVGTGGVRFEEKRDVIVYDNRYVVLVQTSASTYRPGDNMEVRVVVANEELMPVENGEMRLEIYDSELNLVSFYPRVAIRSGITETFRFPLDPHCNIGNWLVTAIVGNTTSSVEVLVAEPVTPSFDLKAVFQRFLLRTEKYIRGVIEINSDDNRPVFGRGIIAIGQITEKDMETMMKPDQQPKPEKPEKSEKPEKMPEEWRKWKSQEIDIAGRIEINYDLMSLFNIDVTKALAVQVYIQVTELNSGHERFIQHVIPIFTRDVIYDIRPLEFEAGIQNEFEVIAKRPDGKPAKLEDLIVGVRMIMGTEQGKIQDEKVVEVKDFYTRGRNDIAFFAIDIPQDCIGVLMTITPLSEDGKVHGYRTHAIPLRPSPKRAVNSAKLTIELLPSTTPAQPNANPSVVSSQVSTVGRTSNFYVQLLPSKPFDKFEPIPLSYVLLTNGRIMLTGELTVQPTKECQSKAPRTIRPEEPKAPTCLYNATLPIHITREMMPYSTLFVYALQPSLGFHLAESYRFSVAGLFPNTLTLNAAIVPSTDARPVFDEEDRHYMEDRESEEGVDYKSVTVSERARGKSSVELSFTGTPNSNVGIHVMEFNAIVQGLSTEITKERLLQYLTQYEQVPIVGMPILPSTSGEQPTTHSTRGIKDPESGEVEDVKGSTSTTTTTESTKTERAMMNEEEEAERIDSQRMTHRVFYPIRRLMFGVPSRKSQEIDGDDEYKTADMGRLYDEEQSRQPSMMNHRRGWKSLNQFDVSVDNNNVALVTSMPISIKAAVPPPLPNSQMKPPQPNSQMKPSQERNDVEVDSENERTEQREQGIRHGTPEWYKKLNSKLSLFTLEAFKFMQSGLSIVTDFPSLRIPEDMRRTNFTKLFTRIRKQSQMYDAESFTMRDEARELLADYLAEGGFSMPPPPIMLDEQARTGYYQSIFFNTSRIEAQGSGKVVIPRMKPHSTWLATGFSLNSKSGIAVAQPLRLPSNQGLFILGNFPDQMQVGEQGLLTYGINNYLDKDLTNVVVRIRASADFDIIDTVKSERVASSNGKDYTITIPSLKSLGVETRNVTLIPKRAGVVKILLEVESEHGGDYEVLTVYVRESGYTRKVLTTRVFDLTTEKKTEPIVQKITNTPTLRSVTMKVSGSGLEHFVGQYTEDTNALVGVDRAIIRLWRLIGLRRYLNETSQRESRLYSETVANMTMAYEKLQRYSMYNGSFSFISDQGEQFSSLYLTSFAFGTLMSPFMHVRDNVTINRTLHWILSHQQEDGSFDDQGPCFHYRFCTGEYRRESLTALVLFAMTHDNVAEYAPEFVRRQLYHGERSPMVRAQRYLESRLEAVKSCQLTASLLQLCLVQWRMLPEPTKQKIMKDVTSRQLTVVPETNARYMKLSMEKMTIDDEYLLNSFLVSLYANFGDHKTTWDISRWLTQHSETRPDFATVFGGIFFAEARLKSALLFRQRFGSEKLSFMVDVSADNGQKYQFKVDSTNFDMIQRFHFTLPVNQITYTVSGFGVVNVCFKQMYLEQQPQQSVHPTSFQVSNELKTMEWLSEITARTCVTYAPTSFDQQLAKDSFNRTVIVEVQLPSGMRLNIRQVGFFLSRVPQIMYFTYNRRHNKINFFVEVPSTMNNKPICWEWVMERLSLVASWKPIRVRAYDYLTRESELVRVFPIEIKPNTLGYTYIDAFHKARPSLEEVVRRQFQDL